MSEEENTDIMIEANGLSKYYGDFIAVEDLNFKIRKGEVVAFLGPNGAGKSTTMKMLTGYLAPSSGVAKVCGMEVANNRELVANRIGYLPENGPLYEEMTPITLLNIGICTEVEMKAPYKAHCQKVRVLIPAARCYYVVIWPQHHWQLNQMPRKVSIHAQSHNKTPSRVPKGRGNACDRSQ